MLTVADWNYLEGASVLAPAGVLLILRGCSTGRQGTTTHPIHLLCSKNQYQEPQGGRIERETHIDGRFSHRLSFQFLYGECSPDPRRTNALSFWFFPVVLGGFIWFFSLFTFLVCIFVCLDLKVLKLICVKS